jgi:hypothetical protein
MSKTASRTIAVASALLLGGGLAWVFLSQVGGAGREEAAAVVLSAPPEFFVVRVGRLGLPDLAGELADLAAREPAKRKVGIDGSTPDGSRVILLLDRDADLVDQRVAGKNGTRTQTIWPGRGLDRLERVRAMGTFEVPGLPPGEKKNLYH